MTQAAEQERIENLSWQALTDRFPERWVALRVDEPSNDGIKAGWVIAISETEETVLDQLHTYRAANPGVKFALFNTLSVEPGLDFLLTWPL